MTMRGIYLILLAPVLSPFGACKAKHQAAEVSMAQVNTKTVMGVSTGSAEAMTATVNEYVEFENPEIEMHDMATGSITRITGSRLVMDRTGNKSVEKLHTLSTDSISSEEVDYRRETVSKSESSPIPIWKYMIGAAATVIAIACLRKFINRR